MTLMLFALMTCSMLFNMKLMPVDNICSHILYNELKETLRCVCFVLNIHTQSYLLLAFDLCRLRVIIRGFSSPPQRPMTSDFFLSQILSITFLSYLYASERASISLFSVECQSSELLVPFL